MEELGEAASATNLVLGEWDACDVDLLASWIEEDDDQETEQQHGLGFVQSASSQSPTSEASSLSGAVPRDRNPTRRRQREEIAYLRERVVEMERELTTLRSGGQTLATEIVTGEWEAIAKRQQRARERAERENRKLRGRLESQLKLARSLERLLRKREHAWIDEPGSTKKRQATINGSRPVLSDAAVFTRLLENIDRSYEETTTVLTTNGLCTAPRGHRRVGIKHARQLGPPTQSYELYVEMTDATTLPFSVEASSGAAWRCITDGYMQLDHQVYEDLARRDDVLAIKYSITLSRGRLAIDFTAHAAMKRFVEQDRIVDVWESISDPSCADSKQFGDRGTRVRERGWTVFRCADADPHRTLQLTCMQMMPLISYEKNSASRSGEDKQVGLLTNLALDYYGDQLDLAQHAMENLLLDKHGTSSASAHTIART